MEGMRNFEGEGGVGAAFAGSSNFRASTTEEVPETFEDWGTVHVRFNCVFYLYTGSEDSLDLTPWGTSCGQYIR